jgi:hypothetical protein
MRLASRAADRLVRRDVLNFDIADHRIYDGLELQWFDDVAQGTGMLAYRTRRDSHVVDYCVQRGLRVDPADYRLGAGPASGSRRTSRTRGSRSPTTAWMPPHCSRTLTVTGSRFASMTATGAVAGAADCSHR